jgi:hypothetical protein
MLIFVTTLLRFSGAILFLEKLSEKNQQKLALILTVQNCPRSLNFLFCREKFLPFHGSSSSARRDVLLFCLRILHVSGRS